MPQPLPRTQCAHHTPGSLLKSATAMTLQHSVHVPHARPGATRAAARATGSISPAAPDPPAEGKTSGGMLLTSLTHRVLHYERTRSLSRSAISMPSGSFSRLVTVSAHPAHSC